MCGVLQGVDYRHIAISLLNFRVAFEGLTCSDVINLDDCRSLLMIEETVL